MAHVFQGFKMVAISFVLLSCGLSAVPKTDGAHLTLPQRAKPQNIPPVLKHSAVLPPPMSRPALATYSIAVNGVPLKELLFALTRDAKLNVDIHPKINGRVTLNAVKQTMPQILNRIAKQVPLRYEMHGTTLLIFPDLPYLHSYQVNYINLARSNSSETSVSAEIATAGGSVAGQSGSSEKNKSKTIIKSNSQSLFWTTLVTNIQAILGEKGSVKGAAKQGAQGSRNVIANPMGSLIIVRANQRQHLIVQAFIDQVLNNAMKQVLIEATIIEVELNNAYQSGIDWSRLSNNNGASGNGPNIQASVIDPSLTSAPFYAFQYINPASALGAITATLRLLESFGDVKVLSSPKIMALNNQAALLKVVEEKVYFTVEQKITEATNTTRERIVFTSQIHTVPVGVIMTVIPQINDNDIVSMNIRPTITRITGFATDPAPRLASAANNGFSFDNLIPIIQIREIETLLHVNSGDTVILGGLMQDKTETIKNSLPLLGKLPLLGRLFRYEKEVRTKTELVIFLRPQIIKHASLHSDMRRFRSYLEASDAAQQQANKP